MKLEYLSDVNVRLDYEDLNRIVDGEVISGGVFSIYSERTLWVNVSASDKRFYSSGDVGEGFDSDSFQGWMLAAPREAVQLALPGGEEKIIRDDSTLDVIISKPALAELRGDGDAIRKNGGYSCGMARGLAFGYSIDRINLFLSLTRQFYK